MLNWRRLFGKRVTARVPKHKMVEVDVAKLAEEAGITPDMANGRQLLRFAELLCDQIMVGLGDAQKVPLDDLPKNVREDFLRQRDRLRRP